MWRVLTFVAAVAAVGLVEISSVEAALNHRYSFSNLLDSVGDADLTLSGDAVLGTGQLSLNLDGDPNTPRNGVGNLLANGASGININTYSALTVEFWATADAALNNGFHSAVGFGDVYNNAVPPVDGPNGAGADYIILQTHRGDNVSRGSIAVTNETMGAPWGAETGQNGAELNDNAQHYYAITIGNSSLRWYVDGVPAGAPVPLANPNSHGNANTLAGVSNALARIGTAYDIDPNWAGRMNELRIFSGAATPGYVAASFAAGPATLTPFSVIPEPASIGLALMGLAGYMMFRRKASS